MTQEQDKLLQAARDVVEWAEGLGLYAADGAVLAPVLVRLKEAVDAAAKAGR